MGSINKYNRGKQTKDSLFQNEGAQIDNVEEDEDCEKNFCPDTGAHFQV